MRDGEMTILVADDESQIAELVAAKLRGAGYRVVTASDGQAALELARQEKPDLIITDFHMPLLSGLELCQRLGRDPATKSIPAILLTARGYHLEPHDPAPSGIRRMVSKPFTPGHLLSAVQDVMCDQAA